MSPPPFPLCSPHTFTRPPLADEEWDVFATDEVCNQLGVLICFTFNHVYVCVLEGHLMSAYRIAFILQIPCLSPFIIYYLKPLTANLVLRSCTEPNANILSKTIRAAIPE